MVLVTDLALQFLTTDFIPKIVSKTFELVKKDMSEEDVVKEICSFDFSDATKKRSTSSKAPAAPPKATPYTVTEYLEKFKDSQVCLYVHTRGIELKGKICCKPVNMATYDKDDKKTHRCKTHLESTCPEIETLLTAAPSKAEQVSKIKKIFPKGSPEVLNSTPTEPKAPGGLGKISSVKDQIDNAKLKIESRTPKEDTPPKPTVEKKRLPPAKARVVSPDPKESAKDTPKESSKDSPKLATREPTPAKTPVRDSTPEREETPEKESPEKEETHDKESPSDPPSPSSSCHQTPKSPTEKAHPPSPVSTHPDEQSEGTERSEASVESKRSSGSTPDKDYKTSHGIPKDENNEEYFLTPTHPSAQDYLWMMYSYNEAAVFSKDFDACYGFYRTDEKIDPDKDFKVSSAWKKLLKQPSADQKLFVTERGIEMKSID